MQKILIPALAVVMCAIVLFALFSDRGFSLRSVNESVSPDEMGMEDASGEDADPAAGNSNGGAGGAGVQYPSVWYEASPDGKYAVDVRAQNKDGMCNIYMFNCSATLYNLATGAVLAQTDSYTEIKKEFGGVPQRWLPDSLLETEEVIGDAGVTYVAGYSYDPETRTKTLQLESHAWAETGTIDLLVGGERFLLHDDTTERGTWSLRRAPAGVDSVMEYYSTNCPQGPSVCTEATEQLSELPRVGTIETGVDDQSDSRAHADYDNGKIIVTIERTSGTRVIAQTSYVLDPYSKTFTLR